MVVPGSGAGGFPGGGPGGGPEFPCVILLLLDLWFSRRQCTARRFSCYSAARSDETDAVHRVQLANAGTRKSLIAACIRVKKSAKV